MRTTLLLLYTASLTVACAHPSSPPSHATAASPFAPGEEDLGPTIRAAPTLAVPSFPALAAVRIDAWLYAAPDLKARRFRANPVPFHDSVVGARGVDPWQRTRAVRVVAQDGDWLTIETGRADACNENLLEGLAVRFYVRPDALAPVTTRALVLTDSDGTKLALPAGTPVDSDPVVVAASWWLVRAALPADAIGTTYRADPIRATTRIRDESTHVEAHVRPRVRGEPAWSRYDTEPPVDLPPGVMRIPIAIVERRGDETLIESADACGRLRGLIPTVSIESDLGEEGGEEGGEAGGFGFGRAAKFRFRAGASLSWPDGSGAGTAIDAVYVFYLDRTVDPTVDRTCGSFGIGPNRDWRGSEVSVPLCVANSDLLPL